MAKVWDFNSQEQAVYFLRDAIHYIESRQGGTQAATILRDALKRVMPKERPELKHYQPGQYTDQSVFCMRK